MPLTSLRRGHLRSTKGKHQKNASAARHSGAVQTDATRSTKAHDANSCRSQAEAGRTGVGGLAQPCSGHRAQMRKRGKIMRA